MCKEMVYDFVTDRLGRRKKFFLESLDDYEELRVDIEKLKNAITFTNELSNFEIDKKTLDKMIYPSRSKILFNFIVKVPVWIKIILIVGVMCLGFLLYIENKPLEYFVEVQSGSIQNYTFQDQTLRFALSLKSGDNLTGLIEKKLLDIDAKPTQNIPLWQKVEEGVLFTFTIERNNFFELQEFLKKYGDLLNIGELDSSQIDSASFRVELLLNR